jgi:methionine--tRNA ligase beta chain
VKDTINYSGFEKIDIRVGTIIGAEEVEGSEKLIKLIVDIGHEKRQILTGMKKWYVPDNFIGLQTLVLVNLETRKMLGIESRGMLLSIGTDHNKKPILIVPKEEAENGTGVS